MDLPALMRLALEHARSSGVDVPVGAVLVDSEGVVVAGGSNRKEELSDPTLHAEIEVIKKASEILGDWRLTDLTLVVTLEPCVMCAGAIQAARIPRVVFGAFDPMVGAGGSRYDLLRDKALGQQIEVIGGVLEKECSLVLEEFFRARRG
jgi:tRNA(adenine34) deaminase